MGPGGVSGAVVGGRTAVNLEACDLGRQVIFDRNNSNSDPFSPPDAVDGVVDTARHLR